MLTSVNPISFEDFLIKSRRANNNEELFSLLTDTLNYHGYDKVIFSVTRDGDLPEDKNGLGVFHNYPLDWKKYYDERSYADIDPVLRCAATYDGPFRWRDLQKKLPLTRKQNIFFKEGEDAGLRNGVGVPIRGNRGQLSGIAMASSNQKDACNENLDLLNAYCQQFYSVFKSINRFESNNNSDALITLSNKEKEVLKYCYKCLSSDEIAEKLCISNNTVNTHLKRINIKMDTTNRYAAVIKAILLGIINP